MTVTIILIHLLIQNMLHAVRRLGVDILRASKTRGFHSLPTAPVPQVLPEWKATTRVQTAF